MANTPDITKGKGALTLPRIITLWTRPTDNDLEHTANKIRLEIYSGYLASRNRNQLTLNRRSDSPFALLLDQLPDEFIVGFGQFEKYVYDSKLDPTKRYDDIKAALKRFNRMEKSPKGFSSGLSSAFICHQDMKRFQSTNSREKYLPSKEERAIQNLISYWLDAILQTLPDSSQDSKTVLDNRESLKVLAHQCKFVFRLSLVHQMLLSNLFASLSTQNRLYLLIGLTPHLIVGKPGEGISSIRLALVDALVQGAKSKKEIEHGIYLALNIPESIVNRFLLELSIDQSIKTVSTDNWANSIPEDIANRGSTISIGRIGDISLRHSVFLLLQKATFIESVSSDAPATYLANKVSRMIDGFEKESFDPRNPLKENEVQEIVDLLRPLEELSGDITDQVLIVAQVSSAIRSSTRSPSRKEVQIMLPDGEMMRLS